MRISSRPASCGYPWMPASAPGHYMRACCVITLARSHRTLSYSQRTDLFELLTRSPRLSSTLANEHDVPYGSGVMVQCGRRVRDTLVRSVEAMVCGALQRPNAGRRRICIQFTPYRLVNVLDDRFSKACNVEMYLKSTIDPAIACFQRWSKTPSAGPKNAAGQQRPRVRARAFDVRASCSTCLPT